MHLLSALAKGKFHAKHFVSRRDLLLSDDLRRMSARITDELRINVSQCRSL